MSKHRSLGFFAFAFCLLLLRANAQMPYSDELARTLIYPLAAAAFAQNPQDLQQCVTNICQGVQVKGVSVDCELDSTCVAFTGVCPAQKAIVISFRGSNSDFQVTEEVINGLFSKKVPATAGGNADSYFDDGFTSLWNKGGLKQNFLALKAQYPNYQLWVTGHSLGAALASLCASTIVSTGLFAGSNTVLMTFGQPRTGDADYAAAVDRLLPTRYRVTHAHDIVPHLPPETIFDYVHHGHEVWYNNNMTLGEPFIECDAEDESKKCSDGQIDLQSADHTLYFNVQVGDWGRAGCPKLTTK